MLNFFQISQTTQPTDRFRRKFLTSYGFDDFGILSKLVDFDLIIGTISM